jgi:hypothetical protein
MNDRVKQITVGASRGRDVAAGSGGQKCPRQQRLELRSTRFSNCITSFDKDNLLLIEYE